MCSESLSSEKVSYGPCAHQESRESLAAMAKFLAIRFDRSPTDHLLLFRLLMKDLTQKMEGQPPKKEVSSRYRHVFSNRHHP